MAAILPFLEFVDDPAETELQREALQIMSKPLTMEGLARLRERGVLAPEDVLDVGELTAQALDQSHAELVNTAWIRKAVEEALQGRSFRVQARDSKGNRPNEVFIVLDGPIVLAGRDIVPWNPPATPTSENFSILSWTSKMGCPSFSLPAGPSTAGGSCPGALAGQSIVPPKALLGGAAAVRAVLGKGVRVQDAICQRCYAEGGQYSTSQVQFAQALRFIWTRNAMGDVDFRGGKVHFGPRSLAWIRAMVFAVQNANYHTDGGREGKIDYPSERDGKRYFRWHDSGDIFDKRYLAMMKAVCSALPDITFWAPSRCWATEWGIDAVNQINGPAEESNLIIRPSGYHINEPPPTADQLANASKSGSAVGWAAGSTSYHKSMKAAGKGVGYDFDCGTYAITDLKESAKHTCRHAVAPDGREGCRACWKHPRKRINYTLH